jgi:mono/diheme cytochrome c family protein
MTRPACSTNARAARGLALSLVALCALAGLVPGCGGKSGGGGQEAGGGTAGGSATGSKYDSGPRAADSPVDLARAEVGEKLFQAKGCSACHGFGKRVSGPDLNGVTHRRTAEWMENQILHPEIMTHDDPISHQLLAQYALQMTNQHLTPDEAKSVIEFLKKHNQETDGGK